MLQNSSLSYLFSFFPEKIEEKEQQTTKSYRRTDDNSWTDVGTKSPCRERL